MSCTCTDEFPRDKSNCMSCNMAYQSKYCYKLQSAVNDEFGRITGERFVVVSVFTNCK